MSGITYLIMGLKAISMEIMSKPMKRMEVKVLEIAEVIPVRQLKEKDKL